MDQQLKVVLDYLAILISIIAIILSGCSFYWNRKVAMLSADNNINQYVSTLLTLLERVKKLDETERVLFKKLLRDSDFFGETNKDILHNLAVTEWPVDKDLKEYFKSI